MVRKKRRYVDKQIDKVKLVIYAMIAIAFIGSILGLSNESMRTIFEFLISVLIGIILSMIAGSIVESITGDYLKKVMLNIEILGFNISISFFIIVTVIVKIWLFGF